MKQRLPIVLSAAALAVALLGSTSLGQAARDGVVKAKRATGLAAARQQTVRRGPRGPRGYRGLRGFQGPPGDKGDKGDPASDAYDARNTTAVVIAGTSPETETVVLIGPTLPVGKYAVTAQVVVQGVGYGAVSCQARGPGPTGPRQGLPGMLHVGTGSDSVRVGTLPLSFGATFVAGGTLQLGCWDDQPTGPNPSATASDLVAVNVGNLTQSGS